MAAYGASDVRDVLRDVYPVKQLLDTRESRRRALPPRRSVGKVRYL